MLHRALPPLSLLDVQYHQLTDFLLSSYAASLPRGAVPVTPAVSFPHVSGGGGCGGGGGGGEAHSFSPLGGGASGSAVLSAAQLAELSNSLDAGEDHLRDALAVSLAFWHQDAHHDKRSAVASHAYQALQGVGKCLPDAETHSSSCSEPGGVDQVAPFARGAGGNFSPSTSYVVTMLKQSRHIGAKNSSSSALRISSSVEAVLAASRSVVANRSAAVFFEKMLELFRHILHESSPIVRARITKVLSHILQVEFNLLSRSDVEGLVSKMLLDRAISVREESVKLIGSYVLSGRRSMLSNEYMRGLLLLLSDEGISVRKSVVQLLRDVLLNQPTHPQYMDLCLALLQRAANPREEESIKDIVRATFQQIFFLPPSLDVISKSSSLAHHHQQQCQAVVDSSEEYGISSTSTCDASVKDTIADEEAAADNGDSVSLCTPRDVGGAVGDAGAGAGSSGDAAVNDASAAATHPGGASLATHLTPYVPPVSSGTAPVTAPDPVQTCTQTQVPSPPKLSASRAMAMYVESAAFQLVDLATAASTDSTLTDAATGAAPSGAREWFISLVREVLHGESNGIEAHKQLKARRSASQRHCEKIVAALIEQLLSTEERTEKMMQNLKQRGKNDPKAHIIDVVTTIALFCEAHPPFISCHLSTLLPYLKRDTNFTTAEMSFLTLKVTEIISASTLLEDIAGSVTWDVHDVIEDLTNIALGYSGKNTRAAIKCMALLTAHITHDATPYFSLAEKCFNAVRTIATGLTGSGNTVHHHSRPGDRNSSDNGSAGGAQLNPAQLGRLQRCLMVLGFVSDTAKLCGPALEELAVDVQRIHGAAGAGLGARISAGGTGAAGENDRNSAIAELSPEAIPCLDPTTIPGACYAAATFALRAVPHRSVQLQAAQALCGVFTGCPRLMLLAHRTGLMGQMLGDGFDDQVHERFVAALKDMLVAAEVSTCLKCMLSHAIVFNALFLCA